MITFRAIIAPRTIHSAISGLWKYLLSRRVVIAMLAPVPLKGAVVRAIAAFILALTRARKETFPPRQAIKLKDRFKSDGKGYIGNQIEPRGHGPGNTLGRASSMGSVPDEEEGEHQYRTHEGY